MHWGWIAVVSFGMAFGQPLAAQANEAVSEDGQTVASSALSVMRGFPGKGNDLVFKKDCINCHGLDGMGSRDDRPNLAGQNRSYLIKQISDFQKGRDSAWRAGREQNDMSDHAKGLTAQEIVDVATYYAGLDCRGTRKVVFTPTRKPKIAVRCEVCHGVAGRAYGEPMTPRLAGQKAAYLRNQLATFQHHARGDVIANGARYRGHPMMDKQVILLTPGDAAGLAQYFSAQNCR